MCGKGTGKEEVRYESFFSTILFLFSQTHLLGGKTKQAGYSDPSKLNPEFRGQLQCTRAIQGRREKRRGIRKDRVLDPACPSHIF